MRTREAAAKLITLIKDEFVVCANGFISRDTFNAADRARNFYMLGSMGQASSIGLGFALARPEAKVIVLDGDGNLLMNMGILAMIAQLKPKNFMHVVLDNECYDSTGGQPTLSSGLDLAEVAKSFGIANVDKAQSEPDLEAIFGRQLRQLGPSFLLVKIERDSSAKMPRVSVNPSYMAERFRNA
ncbi:MAG: thiamine pyrophosphate-dependent enzyme [Candidatus Omnitrophota bacterium]